MASRLSELHVLTSLAGREAAKMGHSWLGPGHLLLALFDDESSCAAEALRRAGVTAEGIRGELRRMEEASSGPASSPRWGVTTNPASHEVLGVAKGIAAGLGAEQVLAEHVLLAFLWEPDCSDGLLWRLDVSREAVLAQLVELGVTVPKQELPEPRPRTEWGEPVYVSLDDLTALITELPRLVRPPGISWNRDDDRGWVAAPAGVDLAARIPFALDAWRRRRLPCRCCGFVTLDLDVPLGERLCEVCYWVDDGVQSNNPDYTRGANDVTIVQARENFRRYGVAQERGRGKTREPLAEEISPWEVE